MRTRNLIQISIFFEQIQSLPGKTHGQFLPRQVLASKADSRHTHWSTPALTVRRRPVMPIAAKGQRGQRRDWYLPFAFSHCNRPPSPGQGNLLRRRLPVCERWSWLRDNQGQYDRESQDESGKADVPMRALIEGAAHAADTGFISILSVNLLYEAFYPYSTVGKCAVHWIFVAMPLTLRNLPSSVDR